VPAQTHGARCVVEHRRMPITIRAEAVPEHESGDSVLVQPERIVLSFVLRKTAVTSAGTNHQRGARCLVQLRHILRDGGNVLFLIAQRAGRAVRPKRYRVFDFGA